MSKLYFTYTCPVSRKTYAGHPRDGYLYTHDNNLEEAINIIYTLARNHKQPVTWVINDQEYTDQEGLLHYFKKFQEEGDSILTTMELTTSPEDVDKFDTQAVLTWIDERCVEAGIRIDGLWSLRFLESDLAAIRGMDPDKYAWTRNLAGSCWHQIGIDDSTWGGCPFNSYYPSLNNIRSPAQDDEPQEFVMLEWVSRDIAAILAGGFPATFTLDPADANRKDAGGFDNEQDALKYSNSLIMELARQRELNSLAVINVNEEARHFQTEGHDKAYMLDGMFGCASAIDGITRATYRELYNEIRNRESKTPERLFVCRNVDWRVPDDLAMLYEDNTRQMGFLKSKGNLPVEVFDYAQRCPGNNSNLAYPQENPDGAEVVSVNVSENCNNIDIALEIIAGNAIDRMGIAVWDTGTSVGSRIIESSSNVNCVKPGLDGCIFIDVRLSEGSNTISVKLSR